MALMQCPDCGQMVSDRAEKCPKCGFPVRAVLSESASHAIDTEPDPVAASKRNSKKWLIITIAAVVVLALVGTAIFFICNSRGGITVSEINISKWKVIETTSYGSCYFEATVISPQEEPFVAVIGSYEDDSVYPKLAYVNNGEGKLVVYASEDEDPSIQYRVIGYYPAVEVKSSELTVKYKDREYYDYKYLGETNCFVDIEIQMSSGKNGILLVDLENVTNNDTDYGLSIPIIDGVGKYSYYAELPYKSRGIEISVTAKCFINSQSVSETDYNIEKPFVIEKSEGTYYPYYDGEGVWGFDGFADGFILCTTELTDGGDKSDRNIVNNRAVFLHDGECTIGTYDSADDGILMPKYDIQIIGYMPWKELTKG